MTGFVLKFIEFKGFEAVFRHEFAYLIEQRAINFIRRATEALLTLFISNLNLCDSINALHFFDLLAEFIISIFEVASFFDVIDLNSIEEHVALSDVLWAFQIQCRLQR